MMFSAPLDLSGLGNTPGSSTAKSATSATNAEATQDRFLKLLVAQLNNQDPMNPMDNAQMTTQMTQINTVAGIESLNATLKGMAAQYSSMQTMQGITLIGREALVGEVYVSYTIMFIQIKNEARIGPLGFIIKPGHITICHKPNHAFSRVESGNRKIKKRVATHPDGKVVILLFNTTAKSNTPPCRYVGNFFKHFLCVFRN